MKKDKTRVMRPSSDSSPPRDGNTADSNASSNSKNQRDSGRKGNPAAPRSYEEPKAPVSQVQNFFISLLLEDFSARLIFAHKQKCFYSRRINFHALKKITQFSW